MKFPVWVLIIFSVLQLSAQDEKKPWFVTFGWNGVDYLNSYETETDFNTRFSSIRVTAGKYIWKGLSVEASYSQNTIKDYPGIRQSDLDHVAIDGYILYSFRDILYTDILDGPRGFLDPFLALGAGVSSLENFAEEDDVETNTLNAGGGVNFWINDSVGIVTQVTYKNSKDGWTDSYMEYFIGIRFAFGKGIKSPCFP